MSRHFTEAQIRDAKMNFSIPDRYSSDVYQAWCELADDMLANPPDDSYHCDGFLGFSQRTEEEIIQDFKNYNRFREENDPEYSIEIIRTRYLAEDYEHELPSGGSLELDVEDGVIRYRDYNGNCEDIYRPDEENDKYEEYRALFEAPTLIDLENALQEAQDNFSAETGAKVEEIIDTLPESVDLVPLEEEFEWVFKQVGRKP